MCDPTYVQNNSEGECVLTYETGEIGIVVNLPFPGEEVEGHRDYITMVNTCYAWSCISVNYLMGQNCKMGGT